MMITQRVALKPTKEQEALFWKWSNAARFMYNFSLDLKTKVYKNEGKSISAFDIGKVVTEMKKTEEYTWLNEIPRFTLDIAIQDMDKAFQNFYRGKGFPKFKKKGKTEPAFGTDSSNLHSIDNNHIKIMGIKTPVKTYQKVFIPNKPHNPRIKYDGKYWYLTYGIEIIPENANRKIIWDKMQVYNQLKQKESTEPLGIDLGISHTAVCSNGVTYENINKTPEIQRLEAKKKRLQQQISRKYEMNKQGQKFIKTKNIIKQEKQLKLVQRRINNIRKNYINQMTTEIVKTKPSKIVIEDLAVSNMMKNKYLAKSIQEQCWYEIRRQLEYKGQLYSIPVQIAPRFYPSSKTCSHCGYIDKNLTLADRTFICPECGLEIDRDYNASINYKAEWL